MRIEEPTVEALELIADESWSNPKIGQERNGVTFFDIYQHNACNHTYSGNIVIDGETYGFIIESGDRNGTVVRGWGDPEDVGYFEHPEPPEPYTFLPRNSFDLQVNRPALWGVYLLWRKESWFTEKERGYNYDRHFAPGGKTESYYRDWADKKGMIVGRWSDIKILSDEEIQHHREQAVTFAAMMNS